MTELKLLLLTLIVALAAAACTTDGGRVKDFAVTTTGSPTRAATKADTTDIPQESSSSAEPSAVPLEIQASEAPPTQAPVATDTPVAAVLPVIGPAPGWDNEVWINSEAPLPLEELQGKVVLLEFWTFG